MQSWIGRQGRGECDDFGFGAGRGISLQEKLDEFDTDVAAVGVGIGVPDAVHGVVVVAGSVFDVAAMGGDAGQGEIDGGILRGSLPESDEVGFSFVETAGVVAVAQSAGEAELILGVRGIAGEGGAEGGNGVVKAVSVGVSHAFGVQFATARLLVGVEAGNEVAHGRKGDCCREGENEQNQGRGMRDKLRKLL